MLREQCPWCLSGCVGLRKDGDQSDVYTLAKKLLRLGLIDADQSGP